MYEIMLLSGQEYVDEYATKFKGAKAEERVKAPAEAPSPEQAEVSAATGAEPTASA